MIAIRLKMLRKRSGLTQAELAKQLNITPSALGNYEQGRRLPDIETLVAMAEVLGVSLDYLVIGKEHREKAVSPGLDFCPCMTCYWADSGRTG